VASPWTCRSVRRAHFRALPHTQLNINEGVSTARKTRPGGTAIYGLKVIGQPSDSAVCRGTPAGVAGARGSRMQNAKRARPPDVNGGIADGDRQQRW